MFLPLIRPFSQRKVRDFARFYPLRPHVFTHTWVRIWVRADKWTRRSFSGVDTDCSLRVADSQVIRDWNKNSECPNLHDPQRNSRHRWQRSFFIAFATFQSKLCQFTQLTLQDGFIRQMQCVICDHCRRHGPAERIFDYSIILTGAED